MPVDLKILTISVIYKDLTLFISSVQMAIATVILDLSSTRIDLQILK
jgi:hypothetical protein